MTSPFGEVLKWYKDKGCRIVGEIDCSLRILDERTQNLFKGAEEAGLPVNFHMAPFVENTYGLADLPGMPGLELSLQRFPNLKFFGHSKTFWCEVKKEGRIQELMRKYPNLYGNLSAGSGFNALARDRAYAAKFLTEFQDRLCFGTDICSPESQRETPPDRELSWLLRDMLDKGEISETVFDKVAAGNARRIFGV